MNCTTPLSIGSNWGPYPKGMTVRVTAESVLTHVTVTVEIWKNGVKWKEQTTMGTNAYVVATATGVI
jgi:predicted transcriptional regulator with HTH domain